jgi:predicted DNA-binding transcriptional regulator AlpA
MHGSGKYSKEAGKRLLPTSGVCARYGRSSRTIDRWVSEGVIPRPRYIRGLKYWIEEELDRCDEARPRERDDSNWKPLNAAASKIVEGLR